MKGMKHGHLLTIKGNIIKIDVDELDFVENKEDLELIIAKVDDEIKKIGAA